MKKISALFLALLMIMSMLPMAAMAEAAQEPVKVVMLDPLYGEPSSEKGLQMVHDAILEGTGVDVTSYRFDSASKTEKVNQLLMSNDIKVNVWTKSWSEMDNFGLIQPVGPYLEEYAPNVVAWYADFNAQAWEAYTNKEGVVMGLPRALHRNFNQTLVRQDWLDKLSLEQPHTLEELEKVAYAIKEADPYGNGETIVMLTRSNIVNLELHFLAGFTEHGYSFWVDETDGKVKPRYLQEGYYDFLAKMNQWFEDGLFHEENPTWNVDQLRTYFASGRVAINASYMTECSAQYVNTKVNYPGAEWYFDEAGMTGPNGNKMETLYKSSDEAQVFNIKNTEEEMIACLKVYDWGFADWENNKTLQSGIKGVHWDYNTDAPNYFEDHVTKLLDVDPSIAYKGEYWYTIGPMELVCMNYDADGLPNFHQTMIRQQPNWAAVTQPQDLNWMWNTAVAKENVMSYSDIETMVSTELMAFWRGERDLTPESWEAFIQELYDIGLQEYIDEYTRQYEENYKV